MKKLASLVASFATVTAVMAVCYGPWPEKCPRYPTDSQTECPDGSLWPETGLPGKIFYCETPETIVPSHRTTEGGAFGLSTNNTTPCKYECFSYGGSPRRMVNCGLYTNTVTSRSPDGTTSCPGTGTGTGTGTGSPPPE